MDNASARARPAHGKFMVGWIAAIEPEYLAARQVLDEEYKDLKFRQQDDDRNVYTFGRIGDHYVVIATLPTDIYGTHSAAAVADGLKASFPLVRFVLMVGVAGGAPTVQNDVRLGDVVVGSRMIPYSVGKKLLDGHKYTGDHIVADPQLLSATRKVNSELCEATFDLHSIISEKFTKSQKIKDIFQRPEDGFDRLYRSDYAHTDSCDCLNGHPQHLEALVVRPERKEYDRIKVHCGNIGSADTVIKDAVERDNSSQAFDLLCFEMESAGLMRRFPCLPLRGICDYADSHKNKQWQRYAAAVAAVYARTILCTVPPANSSQANRSVSADDIQNEIQLVVQKVTQVTSPLEGHESRLDHANRAMEEVKETVAQLNQLSEASSTDIGRLGAKVVENTGDIALHEDELKKLNEGQKQMENTVELLKGHIKKERETSPDERWEDLHEQAENQTASLKEAAKATGDALNTAANMLDRIHEITGKNPALEKAIKTMRIPNQTTKLPDQLSHVKTHLGIGVSKNPSKKESSRTNPRNWFTRRGKPEPESDSNRSRSPGPPTPALPPPSRTTEGTPTGTSPGQEEPQLPRQGTSTSNSEIPGPGVTQAVSNPVSQEKLRNDSSTEEGPSSLPPGPPISPQSVRSIQSQAANDSDYLVEGLPHGHSPCTSSPSLRSFSPFSIVSGSDPPTALSNTPHPCPHSKNPPPIKPKPRHLSVRETSQQELIKEEGNRKETEKSNSSFDARRSMFEKGGPLSGRSASPRQ